jgi:hypothetical protein
MRKILFSAILICCFFACKKTEFAPEGPTDVRIRNLSDMNLEEVILKTSENTEDVDTINSIPGQTVSEYFRFTKAYPKAEISAKINIGGSLLEFSTGPVDFTYMQYIGQDRITFEVYISNMNNRELKISNIIQEEPLILK